MEEDLICIHPDLCVKKSSIVSVTKMRNDPDGYNTKIKLKDGEVWTLGSKFEDVLNILKVIPYGTDEFIASIKETLNKEGEKK